MIADLGQQKHVSLNKLSKLSNDETQATNEEIFLIHDTLKAIKQCH